MVASAEIQRNQIDKSLIVYFGHEQDLLQQKQLHERYVAPSVLFVMSVL